MTFKESFKFSFIAMAVSYAVGIIFQIILYNVIQKKVEVQGGMNFR